MNKDSRTASSASSARLGKELADLRHPQQQQQQQQQQAQLASHAIANGRGALGGKSSEDEFVDVFSRDVSTSSNWSNVSAATARKKHKPPNLQLKAFERSDSDLASGHRDHLIDVHSKSRTDAAGVLGNIPRQAAVMVLSPKLGQKNSKHTFASGTSAHGKVSPPPRNWNQVVGARTVQPESYVPFDPDKQEPPPHSEPSRDQEQSVLFKSLASSRLASGTGDADRSESQSHTVRVADSSAGGSRAMSRRLTSSSGGEGKKIVSRTTSRATVGLQERCVERRKKRQDAAIFLRKSQKSYSQDDSMLMSVSTALNGRTLESKLDNLDVWGEEDEDVADLDQNFGAPRVLFQGGALSCLGTVSATKMNGIVAGSGGLGEKGLDFARQYLAELAAHESTKQKYERTTKNLETTVARIHHLNQEYKAAEKEFAQKLSAVEDELYQAVNENLQLMSAHAEELQGRVLQHAELCSEIVDHKNAREESAAKLRNLMETLLASPELAEQPDVLQELLCALLPARPDEDCLSPSADGASGSKLINQAASSGRKTKDVKDEDLGLSMSSSEQPPTAVKTVREKLLEADLEQSMKCVRNLSERLTLLESDMKVAFRHLQEVHDLEKSQLTKQLREAIKNKFREEDEEGPPFLRRESPLDALDLSQLPDTAASFGEQSVNGSARSRDSRNYGGVGGSIRSHASSEWLEDTMGGTDNSVYKMTVEAQLERALDREEELERDLLLLEVENEELRRKLKSRTDEPEKILTELVACKVKLALSEEENVALRNDIQKVLREAKTVSKHAGRDAWFARLRAPVLVTPGRENKPSGLARGESNAQSDVPFSSRKSVKAPLLSGAGITAMLFGHDSDSNSEDDAINGPHSADCYETEPSSRAFQHFRSESSVVEAALGKSSRAGIHV
ncbi:hypothetical protein FVE85_9029 [Porphyridium purpureum]|uniref:Uncharacterized protein n=1 Tax=Porphyridium purpureum TaxID=35688 RepID=A0A5J4YQT5_PORPP|nr:hypothetical protein FVE85_9029 [Porphyridium purpureum]|eukprot:POR6917..scf222_8